MIFLLVFSCYVIFGNLKTFNDVDDRGSSIGIPPEM